MFKVGQKVRPRPEWVDDPNQVPRGIIDSIIVWGAGKDRMDVIRVAGQERFFIESVFEADDEAQP